MSEFIKFARNKLNETDIQLIDFKYDFVKIIENENDLSNFLSACYSYLVCQYFNSNSSKSSISSKNASNLTRILLKKISNKCLTVLKKKSHDYSSVDNRYSNFTYVKNHVNRNKLQVNGHDVLIDENIVFLTMMGIKLARLHELINKNKNPKNESIEDSIIDIMNYRLLWEGFKLGLQ